MANSHDPHIPLPETGLSRIMAAYPVSRGEAMEIIYQLNDRHVEQLHLLYQKEWWSRGRTLAATRKCVEASQLCVALVENGELLGFARVLTDFVFKAFVFDVIVREDRRGECLGEKLLGLVTGHEALREVRHFGCSRISYGRNLCLT